MMSTLQEPSFSFDMRGTSVVGEQFKRYSCITPANSKICPRRQMRTRIRLTGTLPRSHSQSGVGPPTLSKSDASPYLPELVPEVSPVDGTLVPETIPSVSKASSPASFSGLPGDTKGLD